jgi:hypothetical protein
MASIMIVMEKPMKRHVLPEMQVVMQMAIRLMRGRLGAVV